MVSTSSAAASAKCRRTEDGRPEIAQRVRSRDEYDARNLGDAGRTARAEQRAEARCSL